MYTTEQQRRAENQRLENEAIKVQDAALAALKDAAVAIQRLRDNPRVTGFSLSNLAILQNTLENGARIVVNVGLLATEQE